MKITKILITYLLLISVIVIVTFPLWIKLIPTSVFSHLSGQTPVVGSVVCRFSTKVGGESMSPLIAAGSIVTFNRCFSATDLAIGTVVLFRDGTNTRIGIIRTILPLQPSIYVVSNEKSPNSVQNVIQDEIMGINQEIDTRKTLYQNPREEKDYRLAATTFLSDLYLGKIPRAAGIEMATIEKTQHFNQATDKFCTVTVPKKILFEVDIEITAADTGKVITTTRGVVLPLQADPHISCQEIGHQPGMLNLVTGSYRYRFIKDHQVLADIPFSVQ